MSDALKPLIGLAAERALTRAEAETAFGILFAGEATPSQIGGLLMGQQMGLGFARLYNPSLEDDADVLGQVLFFMALAGFLLVGGHEA